MRRISLLLKQAVPFYVIGQRLFSCKHSGFNHNLAKMVTLAPFLTTSCRQIHSSCVWCARRMRGSRRPRHREPAEGDWVCQCGELNYRSKRECYKCGGPSPPLPPGVRPPSLPGEDPHDWACPCGCMNFRGSVICYKCKQPKPVPPPLPGTEVTLWTCSGCKSVNRSTRKYCFKCSAPSPLTEMSPVKL